MIVNMMRTHQRWLMTVIAVLVIISFIWFFSNRSRYDRMGTDRVATVYGQSISSVDFERTIRQLRTASDLGLKNLTAPDAFSGRDPALSVVNFYVLRHQAGVFGIEPTDAEVEAASQKAPAFEAAGGGFDPAKYAEFVDKKLGPRGFSDRQVDDLVRADLQIGKLKEVVDSTSMVSPAEVRLAFEQRFSKTVVNMIRLEKSTFAAEINPTEDEIKKYYEAQKDRLQFPEKRRVQYVVFGLDPGQEKLTGKERVEAMRPKAEAAEKFIDDLVDLGHSFEKQAEESKATIKETAEFSEAQAGGYPEANIPHFTETAFHLTQQDATSEVLETPTAYYILHLGGITPAKPMSLDEARPKIVAAIKDERAGAALAAKAEEIRTKVETDLKSGKPFADAARNAGQKVEEPPPFSAAEPAQSFSDAEEVSEAAMELNVGELSKLSQTRDGGVLVYVRERQGIDEKKFDAQKEMLGANLKVRRRRADFMEWLRASRDAADVRFEQNQAAIDG